ncbi:hypothetical protein GGS24DRAFT_449784 [Hypoxylon argillaceum]|nr:hypothetical protein GGS24DRAFT_449784 [Hypoxylon argillaceum]
MSHPPTYQRRELATHLHQPSVCLTSRGEILCQICLVTLFPHISRRDLLCTPRRMVRPFFLSYEGDSDGDIGYVMILPGEEKKKRGKIACVGM